MSYPKENTTLHVGRVPVDLTTAELEDALEDCGPLKRCFVVSKKAQNNPKGKSYPFTVGYAQFAFREDAEKCLAENGEQGLQVQHEGKLVRLALKWAEEKRDKRKREEQNEEQGEEQQHWKQPRTDSFNGKSDEQRQFDTKLAKEKKARLIVRNLSFKAEDEHLKEHFQACGEVKEVKILKKPDGKKVGCAFVQFTNVASAAAAIKQLNKKPLLGRPIAVDWAVAKDRYQKENPVKAEVKEEEEDEEEIKEEIKSEPEDSDDEEEEDEDMDFKEENDDDEDDFTDSDEEEEDEDEEGNPKKKKEGFGFGGERSQPHNLTTGHDVSENRTVFLRNLSFDSEEGDLLSMMRDNFGPVLFARLVMDRETEHPKGTAFVKFTTPDSVDKVLEASDSKAGLWLDDRQIYAAKAMSKEDADEQKRKKHEKVAKDSRNLHLSVEGLIRPGTQAAHGVSKTDMEKRAKVEKWKRNVLKDLSMFISPNRLCVRNLPDHVSDPSLRKTFLSCLDEPKSATITECKVIRDFHSKVKGPKQQGKSKGYAFVTFTKHEHALEALRKLNNNPKTFGKDQRPMVEFSVENKKAVNARVKRLEKSRENNPNMKKMGGDKGKAAVPGNLPVDPNFQRAPAKERLDPASKPAYMGSVNDPKQRNMPSHSGAKIRHVPREGAEQNKISRKSLRNGQKKMKKLKKLNVSQKEIFTGVVNEKPESAENKTKKEKKKKGKKGKKFSAADTKDFKEEKQFSALVDKYKSKLSAANEASAGGVKTRKKWFDAK